MTMFPGPGAQIYRNEAGEPLGWDYPSDEPEYLDPYEEYDRYGAADAAAEDAWERLLEMDDDELGQLHEVAEGVELGTIHDAMAERGLVFNDPACERCAYAIAEALCVAAGFDRWAS